MTTDIITADGEVVDQSPITLFGTTEPVAVVQRATAVATALADVIKQKKLAVGINKREHVLVEGWTLLGSMLGVFAEVEWTRSMENGWEARAVARTLNGRTVGAAEAMCTKTENLWKNRDDYAIRSMAQTRAVSKALRLPLGFIMELAGYSATPAEELDAQPQAGERSVRSGAQAAGTATAAAKTPPAALSDDAIRLRYQYALQEGWPNDEATDEAAIASTGSSVMDMEPEVWQVFARGVVKGGPRNEQPPAQAAADAAASGSAAEPGRGTGTSSAPAPEPPRPGTDEYKALGSVKRAEAMAYWTKRDREQPEQEALELSA